MYRDNSGDGSSGCVYLAKSGLRSQVSAQSGQLHLLVLVTLPQMLSLVLYLIQLSAVTPRLHTQTLDLGMLRLSARLDAELMYA